MNYEDELRRNNTIVLNNTTVVFNILTLHPQRILLIASSSINNTKLFLQNTPV